MCFDSWKGEAGVDKIAARCVSMASKPEQSGGRTLKGKIVLFWNSRSPEADPVPANHSRFFMLRTNLLLDALKRELKSN